MAERSLDDLVERLALAAGRRTPVGLRIAGGGAFPDPVGAKVLYAGLAPAADTDRDELDRMAAGARGAAAKAGVAPQGGPFHPHVTVARTGRPVEATRWLRVLDAYRGPGWSADTLSLVVSHLGEGPHRRPRYELVETFPVGAGRKRSETAG